MDRSLHVPDRPDARSLPLPSLIAFESVARHRNFARAAGELDVTPTAMSKTIKTLEQRLGVRLFNRTTRSVALTEPAALLLDSLAPALEQIRRSVQQVGDAAGRPHGLLRINTSHVGYASVIEPHLPEFLARHPEIQVEFSVDNTLVDIVAGGFDAGLRLGHSLQRDMVAVPIGPVQHLVVVGAPAYFERHAPPKRPRDLLQHDCIRQRTASNARIFDWEFGTGRRTTTIEVRGRLVFDDMRTVVNAARMGCGLAYVFRQFVAPDLASGSLVAVLGRDIPPDAPLHLYYPNRGLLPAKLRAFVDFLRAANPSPVGPATR